MSDRCTIIIVLNGKGYSVKPSISFDDVTLRNTQTLEGARWLSNQIKRIAESKGMAVTQKEEGVK